MTRAARLATAAMAACILPAACVMLTACTPQRPVRLDANMLLENEQLRTSNEELHKQLLQRDEQILALQNLGDKRLGRLYTVRRITLGSGTGGANTDDKPGDDAVKVNVAPIDQHGSVLKAAGSVKVQVFDLAAPEGKNLLAERDYDPNAAAKNWSSGLFSSYYGFTLPLPAAPPAHSELTVRAEFTEYLTGKTFTTQQVIKVALPPKPTTQPASQPATQPATAPATHPASIPATKPATQPASELASGPASRSKPLSLDGRGWPEGPGEGDRTSRPLRYCSMTRTGEDTWRTASDRRLPST